MYRTGDLGRWLPEGTDRVFGTQRLSGEDPGLPDRVGRDRARLVNHPGVREAVVVASEDGDGGKRLVAYYTGEEIGAEALRAHLRRALPEYMAPAAYVHLESLPLTPNGKLDRRALPAPEGEAYLKERL